MQGGGCAGCRSGWGWGGRSATSAQGDAATRTRYEYRHHSQVSSDRALCVWGGGEGAEAWTPKVQKFVYQKQPNHYFLL